MKLYNVGILGATGAVGQEMMKILLERKFPVGELRPIASARSAGSEIDFGGRKCTIVEASDDAFEGLDIVLGAAENDIAERFAPAIVKSGAVFVDNSSAFRLDPKVPLVIPEINPEDVKWHSGIISNPNCTTIVTLVAINALAKESPIETIIASSYQAVSGAGQEGLTELMRQTADVAAGRSLESHVFPAQIACNVIPFIGAERAEVIQRAEFYINVDKARFLDQIILKCREKTHAQEDEHRAQHDAFIKACADGETHAGRRPQAGRRGQALDLLPSGDEDGARAEKADAVDDLRAEARNVGLHAELYRNVLPRAHDHRKLILTEQHGQRRAQAYQHIGPEACRPALPLPLQSDEAPEEHGHSQAQQDGGHVHLPQVCQSFHHSVHTPLSAPRRAVKQ